MSWKGYYDNGKQYEMIFKSFEVEPVPEGAIRAEGEDNVGTFRF